MHGTMKRTALIVCPFFRLISIWKNLSSKLFSHPNQWILTKSPGFTCICTCVAHSLSLKQVGRWRAPTYPAHNKWPHNADISFLAVSQSCVTSHLFAFSMLTYYMSKYLLQCESAVPAGVHCGGYLNNQRWWNDALTFWIHCLELMNLSISSVYTYIERNCFYEFLATVVAR